MDSPIGAVRDPETAHSVEHAHDFHDTGGLGYWLVTFIVGDPIADGMMGACVDHVM